MHITHEILPNKLRVVYIDTESFPSLTTLLLVKAGSRYETPENNGIAHFFEHMAFKGSKKYTSAKILAEMIEGRGGLFNAYTTDDHTGYYVKSPVEEAETVIDVLGDMIQHPLLSDEEIQKEKGVIVQEINMYEDMPQSTVYELFEKMMFEGHPLGYKIIGSKKTVTEATRKTFTDYIDEWYHPANATLVLAGGLSSSKLSHADISKLVHKRFASWKDVETPSVVQYTSQQTGQLLHVEYKKSEQAHFCLGYRTFSFKDDRKYILKVLSAVLGMGMTSRLFLEVREKRGLCYSVHTYTEHYEDTGYMATYAGVEPHAEKIQEALRVVAHEHARLTTELVPADELDRAKELIKGRLILSLEDTYNVASMFGTRMLFQNGEFDMNAYIKKIQAVTPEEVRDLAAEIFRDEARVCALIGPYKSPKLLADVLAS